MLTNIKGTNTVVKTVWSKNGYRNNDETMYGVNFWGHTHVLYVHPVSCMLWC